MSKASDILDNVSKVIVGKRNVSELVLTSIIADGHVLLEDVPGTGKTMMAKAFAKSIDGQFSRIQFTPDLLPSDITGVHPRRPRERGEDRRHHGHGGSLRREDGRPCALQRRLQREGQLRVPRRA